MNSLTKNFKKISKDIKKSNNKIKNDLNKDLNNLKINGCKLIVNLSNSVDSISKVSSRKKNKQNIQLSNSNICLETCSDSISELESDDIDDNIDIDEINEIDVINDKYKTKKEEFEINTNEKEEIQEEFIINTNEKEEIQEELVKDIVINDNQIISNISQSTEKIIQNELTLMNCYHKNYLINQINGVYSFPLLPIVEDTEFQVKDKLGSSAKALIRKGYWDRKIGKVCRVKFLCQVCGRPPAKFKGYRIHSINGWAKSALNTFALSFNILQTVLAIGGFPNGVGEIGRLVLQSLDTLHNDIIKSKLDGVDSIQLEEKRKNIEQMVLNYEKDLLEEKISAHDINLNLEPEYVPINADYVRGIGELFEAFGETNPPKKCGLVSATRAADFECAWVCCGSSNGESSQCYKKFMESKELNTSIRFLFK